MCKSTKLPIIMAAELKKVNNLPSFLTWRPNPSYAQFSVEKCRKWKIFLKATSKIWAREACLRWDAWEMSRFPAENQTCRVHLCISFTFGIGFLVSCTPKTLFFQAVPFMVCTKNKCLTWLLKSILSRK